MDNSKFARRSKPAPNPDAVAAFMAGAETHSTDLVVPAPEPTPAAAPVASPAPASAPAPAPEAERLVQLSGRITESDSMKLRLYCIHNKLTTQEWMRQAIRALP